MKGQVSGFMMIIIGAIVGIIVLNSMTAPFCTGTICVPEEGEENLKMYGVAFMDNCTGICAGTQYVECEGVILGPSEYNYAELLILNSTFCEYELIHDYDYEIWSWTDLNATRNDLSASYILMRDLTTFDADYLTFNDPATNGWEPIGTNLNPFTGEFNGNWYGIDGLYSNRGESSLMGRVDNAIINHLFLIEVNITSNNLYAGGLSHQTTHSIIHNTHVTSGFINGNYGVGGLIGATEHSIIIHSSANTNVHLFDTGFPQIAMGGGLIGIAGSNTTIYDCNSRGSVIITSTTNTESIGGLVGQVVSGGNITKSFSESIVDTLVGNWVGGLIGMSATNVIIADSYARGNVTGEDNIGGLIGYADSTQINDTYSTGFVTGASNTGGLIGSGVPIVTNSYWDNITSGQLTSAGGTPFNTTHMTTPYGTFTPPTSPDGPYYTWDFDNTWEHDTWAINDGYPTLQYEFAGETCTQHWEEDTGTGTTGGILGYIVCLLPVLAALGILAIAILGVVIM